MIVVLMNLCEVTRSFRVLLEPFENWKLWCLGVVVVFLDFVNVEALLGLIKKFKRRELVHVLDSYWKKILWRFVNDIYTRYLSIYIEEMLNLENTRLIPYTQFQHGGSSTQLGDSNTFGWILIDLPKRGDEKQRYTDNL